MSAQVADHPRCHQPLGGVHEKKRSAGNQQRQQEEVGNPYGKLDRSAGDSILLPSDVMLICS
ncbi:hypothetical protein [Undibacterium sp. RuTC16W]|uniref:hypothetical protein n=1 Tax=Undibacterium sp. RuTC16W TaxID=3413048 RepID=UPI003BF38FAC